MSELGGEKIDIVQWSANLKEFITEALSPAKVLSVEIIDEATRHVKATVSDDQQSLAIGRGGQNVRLAAKLCNAKIDIASLGGAISTEEKKEEVKEGEVETEIK
jgi:N utilization substance protein A